MTVVGRRYVLVKVEPGDWLLPGNDGRTLWRLHRYRENGSLLEGGSGPGELDGKPVIGDFWAVWHYVGVGEINRLPEDFLEWDRWECTISLLATREQAIKETLTGGER